MSQTNTTKKLNMELSTNNQTDGHYISVPEDFIRKVISEVIEHNSDYGIDDVLGENLRIKFMDQDGTFRICDFIKKTEICINPGELINIAFLAFSKEYFKELMTVIGEELRNIVSYNRIVDDYDSIKGSIILCSSYSEPEENDIVYRHNDTCNVIPMIAFLHAKATNQISLYPVRTSYLEKWNISADDLFDSLNEEFNKSIRFARIEMFSSTFGEMITCSSKLFEGKIDTEPKYHLIHYKKVRDHIHTNYPKGAYVSFPTEFVGFIWNEDCGISYCDSLTMDAKLLQNKVDEVNPYLTLFAPYSRNEANSPMRSALYYIPNNPDSKIRKIA